MPIKPLPHDSPVGADETEIIQSPDLEAEADDELATREREARVRSLEQDLEHRERYAKRLFWFVTIWLVVLLALLALQATWSRFYLSDNVLMTLIGGTTANVLGLFAIVANYFFPKRQDGATGIDPPSNELPKNRKSNQ